MDRYQKVEKPRVDLPINENEIRITIQGQIRNYLTYATTLLQEKCAKEIVFKAMGQAISKTVAIAEIVKKRIPRLHQDTTISSMSITDVWEPIEEGLELVEQTRHVSMISITLSLKELNKESPGYQAPNVVDHGNQQYYPQQQQPRQGRVPMNEDSFGRGRGRGRGRGHDWGRGGYGNYQDIGGRGGYGNYHDNGRRGGYGNYQYNAGRGRYGNYKGNGGGGGYGNYQDNEGYSNWGRGGYGNYQDNDGYPNCWRGGGRGGGRGRVWDNRGMGYERGRGAGDRGGYGRSRGRMGGRMRGGSNQA